MSRADVLGVWLRGERLGELEKLRGGDLRLRFAPEAISSYGSGTHIVSLALPLTSKRVQGERLRLFIRGLLPEGPVRAVIERQSRVPFDDDFALLTAIGGECAGALQFLPDDAPPSEGQLRPLDRDEVIRIVEDLPTLDAPDGLPIGASLGGVQAKVLLSATNEGWSWPAFGAMSTHLIKPEPLNGTGLPRLIDAELWASRLAIACGLRSAESHIETFGDRRAIVVRRYDRTGRGRLHQEDFTQALSLRSEDKYEQSSSQPTRLRRLAAAVIPWARDEQSFMSELLAALTFNTVIGNSDAHSKNYSLLIGSDGQFDLAPLYNAAPIMLMDRHYPYAGHALDGQTRLAYVTRDHLMREAIAWGMEGGIAADVVDQVATRIGESLGSVEDLAPSADVARLASIRVDQMLAGATMQHVLGPGS